MIDEETGGSTRILVPTNQSRSTPQQSGKGLSCAEARKVRTPEPCSIFRLWRLPAQNRHSKYKYR